MSEIELNKSVVAICDSRSRVIGTGFIVGDDGLIATCAHVVQAVNCGPGDVVSIVFHATGQQAYATIAYEYWRAPDAEDVAILRIRGSLPEGTTAVSLGSSGGTSGHPFKTFGFPKAKPNEGMWGYGSIGDLSTERGFQVRQLTGATEVTAGFSGAPVLDLRTRSVVGMVTSITGPDQYGRLVETAFISPTQTLRAICPALEIADICPYRGLDFFTEASTEFFFGRERVVDRLLECLRREPRFLTVLGPSGCGKSSVVRAGLLPAMKAGKVPGSDRWGVIIVRPKAQPFEQLASGGLLDPQAGLGKSIHAWLDSHPEKTRLVLVIDQFEEVLLFCPDDIRRAFITELANVLESSIGLSVILILRDDFYSRFQQDAARLTSWLERGLINIPAYLAEDELRAIVSNPTQIVGLAFEEGLVDTILADTAKAEHAKGTTRSILLPLLEFALTQLWEKRQDGRLTHDAYNNIIGGVTGSLVQWADQAYYDLTEEQRLLARRLLTRLVHLGDEGQGTPDTKRQIQLSELGLPGVARRVVDHFVDRRLLVTGVSNGRETVEIIHDALLREWNLLKNWLETDREFLVWQQRLRSAMQLNTPLQGLSLAYAELQLIQRHSDLREDEQRFIRTSIAERDQERMTQERQQKRFQRWLVSGIVITLILALAATLFAITARTNERIQLAKTVASRAQNYLEEDQQRAILLALASQSIISTDEAQSVLSRIPFIYHRPVTTIAEYASRVNTVSWDPNGSQIAIGADEKTIKIWNVVANKLSGEFEVEIGGVTSTSWSPDGLMLVTGGKEILVWNVATSEVKNRLMFYPSWISDLEKMYRDLGTTPSQEEYDRWRRSALSEDVDWRAEWSPNKDLLIVYSPQSSKMWLWDIHEDTTVELNDQQIKRTISGVPCVTWSPDGSQLASSSNEGDVIVWNVGSRSPIQRLTTPDSGGSVTGCVAWSPDGSKLAASEEVSIFIWDATTGTLLKKLASFESSVRHIRWHPTKNLLASDGFDDSITVWDVTEGQPVMRLNEPTQSVTSISWSPDGTKLAAGSVDSMVTIWDLVRNEIPMRYDELSSGTWSATWNSDGTVIASGGGDGKIVIWDTKSRQSPAVLPATNATVSAVRWSPDDLRIATGSLNGKVIIWDAVSKRLLAEFFHPASVLRVAWGPDGNYLAVQGRGLLTVWDTSTNEPKQITSNYPDGVAGIAWNPKGAELVIGQRGGLISIWDVKTQMIKRQLQLDGTSVKDGQVYDNIIDHVAWSPDGSRIAAGGRSSNVIVILDTSRWTIIAQRKIDPVIVDNSGLSWSSDGTKLAVVEGEGVLVWDVAHDELLTKFVYRTGRINDIAWSPDDSHLVLATNALGVVVLSTLYIQPSCNWVSRNLTEEEWKTYVSPESPYQVLCPDRPVPKRK